MKKKESKRDAILSPEEDDILVGLSNDIGAAIRCI